MLSEIEVAQLYSGAIQSSDLIAFWSFDNTTWPLACIGTLSGMTTSAGWSGDVVVPSDAPFSNSLAPLISANLVKQDEETVVSLKPTWAPSNSSILVSDISSGIQVYQLLSTGCKGAIVSAGQQISGTGICGVSYSYSNFMQAK